MKATRLIGQKLDLYIFVSPTITKTIDVLLGKMTVFLLKDVWLKHKECANKHKHTQIHGSTMYLSLSSICTRLPVCQKVIQLIDHSCGGGGVELSVCVCVFGACVCVVYFQ